MQVIRVKQPQKDWYEQFVKSHPFSDLHQSYDWSLFQKEIPGREANWILVVVDKNFDIRGSAMLIKQSLPFGKSWLYCPRGPLVNFDTKVWDCLFSEIKKIAKEEKSVFFRMDPLVQINPDQHEAIDYIPLFQKAHAAYQPEATIILDVTLPEESILAQMKQKGRYNINLAVKKGVKIISPKDDHENKKYLDLYYELVLETTNRDKFFTREKSYYQNLLKILKNKDDQPYAKLYLAQYESQIVAGIIVVFYGDTATYYYGASGNAHRNLMAPYLLQWEAIKEARKKGFKKYDFFGISPEYAENHPWQGVTNFKKKFGGEIIHYSPAQEYVFNQFWFKLILLIKKIRAR